MKKYILKTVKGVDIRITQAQRDAILVALSEDRLYFQLGAQDALIMLKSISQIVPEEAAFEDEARKLSESGKFKCKHGMVHYEKEGCYCWEVKKDNSLIGGIKTKEIAEKMAFPEVTYDDVFMERVAIGEPRAKSILKRR